MWRYIQYISIGILTSFYFFPIGFSFLPDSVNTKMILAVLGIVLFGYKCIQEGGVKVSKGLGGAIILAVLFSLACFVSTDINNTSDYSYATYVVSFSVWLGGAFTVSSAIRGVHGEVNFRLLTFYLAAVCFAQCVAAMMIDNIPAFKLFIDSYVQQGQEFFTEVDRLYGIGAALDPAGVRFSIVLVLIMGLLCKDDKTRNNRSRIVLLLVAFFVISIVGNIISRTTIVGVGLAGFYFVISSGLFQTIVRYDSMKLGLWFGGIFIIAVSIATFLYQTNGVFYGHMRFAFEGFFNWVEMGEWRTDSTDKLNNLMWIWPEDFRTWVIGSGRFDGFFYSTDIGYCRFILYSGLVGFSFFALLFIYLAFLFANQNPQYWLMFMLLLILSLLIWLKVATDIFQIFALLFCLDFFTNEPVKLEDEYENCLHHSRYV